MKTTTESDAAKEVHPSEVLSQPIPADPIASPAATAAPVVPPKLSVTEWATRKGMLPRFVAGKKSPRAKGAAKPPMLQNPKHIHFHKASAAHRWLVNTELTEAEFDKAIATAGAFVYGQAPRVVSRRR